MHSPVEVRVVCTECIAATRMTPLSKRKLSQSVEHTQDGPQGGGGRMEGVGETFMGKGERCRCICILLDKK